MESVPSQTAQLMITVIPILGIVVAGALVFFFLLWNHKQRMAQIDRGIRPDPLIDIKQFSLLLGLLATPVGLVLTIVTLLASQGGYGLLGGLVPFAAGIGFLIYYRIATTDQD